MYTELRGSTYHFRLNVPPRYRHLFGWSIYRSLCQDPIISNTLAQSLGGRIRKTFMEKSLDDATVKRLVDTYIKDTLDTLKDYVNGLEAVSRHMAEGQVEAIWMLQLEKEKALFRRDYSEFKPIVDRLLNGREVDKQSHNKLSRAVLQAAIKLDQIQIDAQQGEPIPDNLEDDQGVHTVGIPEPVDQGPLLSEFIDRFPATKPKWSRAAHNAYRSATKVLLKILGDIQVGAITRAMMVKYRETLAIIPTFWTSRHQDIEVKDLPAPGLPTISQSKFDNNLIYVSQLMDYAVDCGYLDDSPMPRTRMSLVDGDRPDVHQFNDDQVKTILEATSQFDDHRYWLPILGLYTGCRVNELCQLHREDLKKQEGIWYLDINNDGKKTLKNKNSKRRVPLHKTVIELGFVKYAQGVKHHRIFPGCKYRESTGKYANNWGQWFNRLLVTEGIKPQGDRSITFHSFRHRMETALKRLEFNNEHIDQILGHGMSATRNQTYHHGYELTTLKADIDQLRDHRTL